MEIIVQEKKLKIAKSKSLPALIVWVKYFEDYPNLDYMKLQRAEGIWEIKVVLK